MRTKAEAEAKLAVLPLTRAVVVVDDGARRRYSYTLARGNLVEIEIDAEPTETQLSDLAKHLPLEAKDRDAAFEAMKSTATEPEPKTAEVAVKR